MDPQWMRVKWWSFVPVCPLLCVFVPLIRSVCSIMCVEIELLYFWTMSKWCTDAHTIFELTHFCTWSKSTAPFLSSICVYFPPSSYSLTHTHTHSHSFTHADQFAPLKRYIYDRYTFEEKLANLVKLPEYPSGTE